MRVLSLSLLMLLAACTESFLPAWAVTDLRPVAARVDIEGKPGRARPDPEDSVQVSLLVIDRGAPPADVSGVPPLTPPLLRWAFQACLPLPTLIGPPACRAPIMPCEGCVTEDPPADPLALPVMRFRIPSESELDAADAQSVLLAGAVCTNGNPSDDAILRFILGETEQLEPCEPLPPNDPAADPTQPPDGRFVSVSIPIEPEPMDPNLHPEIQNILLDGRSWPPPYEDSVPRNAARTGCSADLEALTDEERAQHPFAGSGASTIDLSVTPDSLQTYVVQDMERIEEIQVSWLTDGGDYERTFSFITDPARSVLTRWQPFADAPEDGMLVRFTFVIRDGRGGTDAVERGLCILPPPAQSQP